MKEKDFYEEIGNWDFSDIKYTSEIEKVEEIDEKGNVKIIDNWNFYDAIKRNTNEGSICLDLGTGGGEKLLKYYPRVASIIGTDFSENMVKTARKNAEKTDRNVKFIQMDSLDLKFEQDTFDLVSARHTIIDADRINKILVEGGKIIVEGIDQKDCWALKEMFGRGQAFKDKISIAEKDFTDIADAGFVNIKRYVIYENEYYQTKEDLLALLLKTPILDNFSEIDNTQNEHKMCIEEDIFNNYVEKFKTDKGILLERVLYGIEGEKYGN